MRNSVAKKGQRGNRQAQADFVMVTFGVRHQSLGKKFFSLLKKSDQSASGLARDLIAEGIKNYPK